MDAQVTKLAEKATIDRRLLVAISGIPGSGKTTFARKIASKINEKLNSENSEGNTEMAAIALPLDGFHFTRAQLSAMDNPENAHARRGAAFTFDAAAFLALVKKLREPIKADTDTIFAPSFDHAIKDPKSDDICILTKHRIVLLEGNYLSLDSSPWRDAAMLMDECWLVDVAMSTARERLVQRHVSAGLAQDEISAGRRADENDLVNAREIESNRLPVDETIQSVPDDSWSQ